MIVRQIDRPTPHALRLVVTNGWNSCSAILRRDARAGVRHARPDIMPSLPGSDLDRQFALARRPRMDLHAHCG